MLFPWNRVVIGDVQALLAKAVLMLDVGAHNNEAALLVLRHVLLVPRYPFLVQVGSGFVEQQEISVRVYSQAQFQALLHTGGEVFDEFVP